MPISPLNPSYAALHCSGIQTSFCAFSHFEVATWYDKSACMKWTSLKMRQHHFNKRRVERLNWAVFNDTLLLKLWHPLKWFTTVFVSEITRKLTFAYVKHTANVRMTSNHISKYNCKENQSLYQICPSESWMAIRVNTFPTSSFQLVCYYFEFFILDTKLPHHGKEIPTGTTVTSSKSLVPEIARWVRDFINKETIVDKLLSMNLFMHKNEKKFKS